MEAKLGVPRHSNPICLIPLPKQHVNAQETFLAPCYCSTSVATNTMGVQKISKINQEIVNELINNFLPHKTHTKESNHADSRFNQRDFYGLYSVQKPTTFDIIVSSPQLELKELEKIPSPSLYKATQIGSHVTWVY